MSSDIANHNLCKISFSPSYIVFSPFQFSLSFFVFSGERGGLFWCSIESSNFEFQNDFGDGLQSIGFLASASSDALVPSQHHLVINFKFSFGGVESITLLYFIADREESDICDLLQFEILMFWFLRCV